MACEKYSGWIIEAALDALSPQRQAEFSAHIAECRACREEYSRICAVSGVVERGVASLVASEPMANFEAKLRARLSAEAPPPRSWHFGWAPIGALAAVLIAAGALFAIRNGQTRHNSLGATVANSVASVDASKTQPAGTEPDAHRGARSDSGEIVLESEPASATETTPRSQQLNATPRIEKARFSSSHQQPPEVLVQPGQFAMIEQYAQAAREGRVDSAPIAKLGDDTAPLDVQAIEIAPLKIQGLPHPDDSNSSDSSDSPDTGKS